MSPKLPRVTAGELVRALKRTSCAVDHQKGSHLFLRHQGRPGLVVVPMHSGRTLRLKNFHPSWTKPASRQRSCRHSCEEAEGL